MVLLPFCTMNGSSSMGPFLHHSKRTDEEEALNNYISFKIIPIKYCGINYFTAVPD
jgi:hypothetical protein